MTKEELNKRNSEIIESLKQGQSLQQVANKYNITRERVRQILREVEPDLPRDLFGCSLSSKIYREKTRERRQQEIKEKFNRDSWRPNSELEAKQSLKFTRKRQNVLNSKHWDFTITMSDLEWPTHCPILGIELDWFANSTQENSPSFDRINPELGYIPGNVIIISWRANRIKNDGTAEEHRKIAEFLENV